MDGYEALKLQRRVALAPLEAIDVELRAVAFELAVACNVIELSPRRRIEAGSDMHERMRSRVDALLHRLDVVDEAKAELVPAA